MARIFIPQSNWKGGLSWSEKEGLKSSFLWGRSIDHRSDPSKLKILPRTLKVSGSTVVDLIMDGDRQSTDTYLYGDAGNIYKVTPVTNSNTGALSPGTMANTDAGGGITTDPWSNPSNAVSSNDSFATASVGSGDSSDYLDASNFGFAIPSAAVITGVVVEVEAKVNIASGSRDITAQLIKGGTAQGNDNANNAVLPTADDVYTSYGSSTDLWGLTLTPDDINASNFGFRYQTEALTTTRTFSVDHIRITVYYNSSAGEVGSGAWSNLNIVANSTGNGMKYFGEDSYLYYTSDKVVGRYGPFGGTKTFADDFLGAQGGVPLNTHVLDLESGSSQYATAADSASLSITGDISIEAYVKWESLPTVGNSMVMVSKWNADTALRSYLFELYAISGYFGDGDAGALTISSDTTQAPVDSACTGTAAAYTLSATNASFTAGDKLLIHQTQGTGAGKWERNEIAGYTAGVITLTNALANSYTTGAQVIVLEEYTNVTVNSGITWTAKAWDGTVGGILAFLASGTVTVTGTITATGKGFRGGTGSTGNGQSGSSNNYGQYGEGTPGVAAMGTTAANGNGGGGGQQTGSSRGAGAGGGNGVAGANGAGGGTTYGLGGASAGTADLTTMVFGGGGGGGAGDWPGDVGGNGAIGGGIIFIIGTTVTVTGSITTNGNVGSNVTTSSGAGGGGAGGSILIKTQTGTLGSALATATGGAGGTSPTAAGGAGGVGRIHLDYYTSYTGTTSPTLDATQDNTLVTTTAYQLRFGVSSTGTNEEFLTKTLSVDPVTGTWYRYAVAWDASASQAEFYRAGVSLGTSTGTLTAIHNNATLAAIGAKFTTGTAGSFLDGKVDDVRVFNDIRTTSELYTNMDTEIGGSAANLQAYWQVDNSTGDTTANANTLTLVNAPVYTTDVPFSSPTTRLDLDQSLDTSGQTETLPTAIDEGATNRQTFVPAKDPQKSIEVNISDKGSGDWTLTVHDALNREIASKTVTSANLNNGDFEFTFASVWRPIIGASYHFHITSTVADGVVVTTTLNDLETVDFHTYFQFLVSDAHHPVEQIVNKLGIGNERYLATWDAATYNPMAITLPSGYRIRCLGTWREYLVMGTMRGTNMTDYDQGRLFFWDGIHTTYNFYVDVPEGGINCILSGDPIYFMAGYSGDFMSYAGGGAEKIRRMPKIATTDTLEFNRKAISMWRALVHIGMAENSTSTTIERGVFSWGTLHREISPTMSFDYPLSLGITTGATLEIGMVFPIGSSLLISWRNAASYGVDSVSPSNSPFATATCEFLITDAGDISKEKQAQVIRAYFLALANSGDSMKIKYKIDRNDNWTEGTAVTTVGVKEARLPLPTKGNRFNEFEYAVDMATTSSTSPEFYGIVLEEDSLAHERRT